MTGESTQLLFSEDDLRRGDTDRGVDLVAEMMWFDLLQTNHESFPVRVERADCIMPSPNKGAGGLGRR